jgi:hypothetical protein
MGFRSTMRLPRSNWISRRARFFGAGWMGKLIRLQHGVLALALSRVQNAHVPWFCCPAAWLAVAGHRGWDVQVEVKHQCDIVCRPDA